MGARGRRSLLGALVLGVAMGCTGTASETMSQERMEAIIEGSSGEFTGPAGAVRFRFEGVEMACISDARHDRMRIVAPVTSRDELSIQELEIMLIANYHTSLDARYAISEGVVYAVYLHPLSSLSEAELRAALRQVASLARTFGSSYSSGELVFGAPAGQPL